MNHEIRLDGKWEFRQAGKGNRRVADWQTGEVPGTVHTDLLAAGLIEDPFYRDNELKLRWIEEADWIYRRSFEVTRELMAGSRAAVLHFEGLDTFAAIRLNGRNVGRTDNMFHGWQFEVKKLLRPGLNRLEIEFSSAVRIAEDRARQSKIQYKSSFFEPRVFIRKAQYAGGWDWGPRFNTCGIWRPVRLIMVGQARITDVCVRTESLSERRAYEQIAVEVDSLINGPAHLRVTMISPTGQAAETHLPVRLRKGRQTLQARLALAEPQLWWPAGHGEQALYEVQVTLLSDDQILDAYQTRTGLRTVELVRRKDRQGECFRFRINGRELFCKGANWVPPDSFLPRFSDDLYRQRIADARDAHMNMLRVWGGGIYESPTFYRTCDELGIMVWQDFMFACAEYPEDRPLLASIRAEAEHAVRRLRNHPCVVLWCGCNENQWGYDAWWPPRPKRYGEVIYDRILPEVCGRLDPTRPYWPGSPYGGPMANHPDYGDQHEWQVWIFWKNPEEYRNSRARFVSEFGYQAMPPARTVAEFTAPEDRRLFSRVIDHHQRCEDGHARNFKYFAHLYGMPATLEEYIYLSQVAQAEAIRLGVEHWRRRWPDTAGTLYWQHNDCWPVASWSAIDYHGRPKGLWFASKRFFSPVLVSLTPVGKEIFGLHDLQVWICNDTGESRPMRLEIAAWDIDGRSLSRRSLPVVLRPRASWAQALLKCRDLRILDPDRHLVHVALWADEELVSDNFHYFAPAKYIPWPDPGLIIRVTPRDGCLCLQVRARRAARGVCLRADDWEGRFSDNFFDLAPGQKREFCWRLVRGPLPSVEDFKRRLTVQSLADWKG